ncbi:MAG: NAD(P)H-hydrate dehydratase [Candidatus Diapherotrites archaeon]|nr:NAD(P)H-hydrate dehydratase [Candidatus Diapherotrites archaeon]
MASILKAVYMKRASWSRKGDFGRLLILAGSKLYTGSPALSGLAALRAGCDWVTIAAPERAADAIAAYSPDLITYPLKGDFISKKHINELVKLSKGFDSVLIGPGLTRSAAVLDTINELISKISKPTVIDDDAIYAVAKNKSVLRPDMIITPHSTEFKVLTGKAPTVKDSERSLLVKEQSARLKVTILLKGHKDFIASGKALSMNVEGSPMMTSAGCGDVLSGICASLLARGEDPHTAAVAASIINGLAGKLAARDLGESLIASDLIDYIPKAIKKKLK